MDNSYVNLLQEYQKASQELTRQMGNTSATASLWSSSLGGSMVATPAYGDNLSGWHVLGSSAAASADWSQGWSQYPNPIPQGKPPQKFNRINDTLLHPDGAPYEQPLDELRVKVAKWLRR